MRLGKKVGAGLPQKTFFDNLQRSVALSESTLLLPGSSPRPGSAGGGAHPQSAAEQDLPTTPREDAASGEAEVPRPSPLLLRGCRAVVSLGLLFRAARKTFDQRPGPAISCQGTTLQAHLEISAKPEDTAASDAPSAPSPAPASEPAAAEGFLSPKPADSPAPLTPPPDSAPVATQDEPSATSESDRARPPLELSSRGTDVSAAIPAPSRDWVELTVLTGDKFNALLLATPAHRWAISLSIVLPGLCRTSPYQQP